MKNLVVCLLLLLASQSEAQSYSRYIVRFKNKATTPFSFTNPSAFLSQRAIDRRAQYNIALDSTDLPVTPRYIDSILAVGNVTVLNASRWLNQVSIQTTDASALGRINAYSFVERISPIAARLGIAGSGHGKKAVGTAKPLRKKSKTFQPLADYYSYGSSYAQVHLHNGEFLHNIGLRGQNMVIGMHDAGYFQYTTLKAFDSVNRNGQVLGVYDFVAKDNSVIEDDAHGMATFSVMAANIPGQFVGTAPKANYFLFRSEDAGSEYPIEEHNWVCAAERVDSVGGDVISSSLGYNTFDDPSFNHTYAQLNGNTTMAAIGADHAAKKGILVVTAAGNEGSNAWGKIVTPADGDSVLAIAAVSASGVPAAFSSRGPSSDGQVKPDVASVGVATVVQTASNTIGTTNGTSFACPNMAGLAACLWQGFREFNNIKILQAIQQSGNRFTTPNDTTGYGIPDMRKAVLLLVKEFSTASIRAASCTNTINWTSKDAAGMKYEVERRAPGETSFTRIGERTATGSLFSAQSYQFSDSLVNVQAGTITYRIREWIDTAASVSDYIDTVSIVLATTCITTPVSTVPLMNEAVVLAPNPADQDLSVRITTAYAIPQLYLRIIDGRGSVVQTKRESKISGTSTINFSVSALAKGKYYLLLYNGERLLATKEFMKL